MQVTDALRVGVNAAYLDATYGDLEMAPVMPSNWMPNSLCGTPAGIAQGSANDLTGVNTLYASDWSGNAFVDFRTQLGSMESVRGC